MNLIKSDVEENVCIQVFLPYYAVLPLGVFCNMHKVVVLIVLALS